MSRRVLVVGAGVSGLTTAKCLINQGFSVTVVAEKSAEFTPSVVAGALWEWPPAVCGHHTNSESLRRSKQWAADSYQAFQTLATQSTPGVRMAPAVFYFRQHIDACSRERQKMEEAARHVQGFERSPGLIARYGVNPGIGLCDAYTYMAPLIETDVYMQWLRGELTASGCRFVQRRLTHSLTDSEQSLCSEFEACAIANCSGLGSMELAGDPMEPLRGALIRVRNDGAAMPRITAAHCISLNEAVPQQQMVYIIPRGSDTLLLGGIAELGEWNIDIGLDNHEPVRAMLHRCREFLPVLDAAAIDSSRPVSVGLRPYREKNVRLEQEPAHRIVHNYGHGGSGFTFSWGCAQETAALLKNVSDAAQPV